MNKKLLKDLDEFKDRVIMPKAVAKPIAQLSFEDRMVDKPGKHIRGFASEVLSMIVIMGLWVELNLVPTGALPEEAKCFLLLGRIVFLLRTGDSVRSKLPLLQQLILEHHELFTKLYPAEAKPKVHFLLHVPEQIAKFQKNLSCFVTERKHKQSKGLGAFCYNMMCDTMLRRGLAQHFKHFRQPEALDAVRLDPVKGIHPKYAKKIQRKYEAYLVAAVLIPAGAQPPGAEPKFLVAKRAQTPAGCIHNGDLLVFRSEGGSAHAAFAQLFFQGRGFTAIQV